MLLHITEHRLSQLKKKKITGYVGVNINFRNLILKLEREQDLRAGLRLL